MSDPLAPQVRRDVRIDRLGLVDELVAQYRKPLAESVKAGLEGGDRLTGDLFEGLLVCGVSIEVDADKFLKAWEAGKITRAEFLSAISVSASRARAVLAEKDLNRMVESSPTSPALRVTRKKGVEVPLVLAVETIRAALAEAKQAAA